MDNTIIIFKSLIFIHIFFNKGPPESFNELYQNSSSKVIKNIQKHWSKIYNENILNNKDIKRSKFNSLVIQ